MQNSGFSYWNKGGGQKSFDKYMKNLHAQIYSNKSLISLLTDLFDSLKNLRGFKRF